MDKQLENYYKTMKQRVKSAQGLTDLHAYHYQRVAEFQHERLIHLLVTFFFGGLLLLAYAGFLLALFSGERMIAGLAGVLALLLTILEAAYIRHYYKLENGTQKLYEITELLEN